MKIRLQEFRQTVQEQSLVQFLGSHDEAASLAETFGPVPVAERHVAAAPIIITCGQTVGVQVFCRYRSRLITETGTMELQLRLHWTGSGVCTVSVEPFVAEDTFQDAFGKFYVGHVEVLNVTSGQDNDVRMLELRFVKRYMVSGNAFLYRVCLHRVGNCMQLFGHWAATAKCAACNFGVVSGIVTHAKA
jgi:hypothetical protein